jgi:lysophospholipase L1-like esterase
MNNRLRLSVMMVLAALAGFPVVAPGETHEQQLRVTPDAACAVTEALPPRVAGLPNFSRALQSGRLVRIVAIGSSSTEGVGASAPTRTYPAQLRALLELALPSRDFEVANLGIGGEVAATTVARLRRALPVRKPDLVIWQVGTNDALKGVPLADYERTLRSALGLLKARGQDVLLVGMQWTRKFAANPQYAAVREATARIAAEQGVTLVSRFDAMRRLAELNGREELIGPDHLHMNDRGYRCLAEQVAVTLARASPATRLETADASAP